MVCLEKKIVKFRHKFGETVTRKLNRIKTSLKWPTVVISLDLLTFTRVKMLNQQMYHTHNMIGRLHDGNIIFYQSNLTLMNFLRLFELLTQLVIQGFDNYYSMCSPIHYNRIMVRSLVCSVTELLAQTELISTQ